ncbi:peptidoglycan DD-metalloendopeptidase family protein [Hyphomicrobium sp.]|uniref:murein hydrolase activator EnvC family protein n=1 Tax=Hyphomicrobium sp. TaxID=82 RepID=UPI0025BE958B|nr:peptidoglycan DD-metalloendopeptidase family protein [Hyphomicrobium sp.]
MAASLFLLPHSGFAQDAMPTDPQTAKRILQEKKHELDVNSAKQLTIQSDVMELGAERERLNSRLIDTAGLIQRSEGQMTAIEGRLSELEEQERIVRGSLAQRHGEIAALLSALQKMGRNPPPVLVTRREDALKMVRSAMLLASAFPDLRDQALSLGTQLADLQRVMGNIRTEGARLQAETDRLNEARTRLASLMEAKKLTLADRQSQLAAVKQESADISKRVSGLSDLIDKLDAAVTEKTGLGAYDEELKKRHQAEGIRSASAAVASGPQIIMPPPVDAAAKTAEATAAAPVAAKAASNAAGNSKAPAPPQSAAADAAPQIAAASASSTRPTADGQKVAMVELAPAGASLIPGSAGRIKPAIPFSDARGKLPLPAQGRRALTFGERTQFGGQSKGIVIETRSAAQVTSPCDGWVVYAGEFRSYGQLLIINAGDGYHVLLAGLSQIDVQPGQFVLTAEPVGTMSGGQKNSSSATPVSGPVLYVELRKDGRPIDPDPWWASGQQKVQG